MKYFDFDALNKPKLEQPAFDFGRRQTMNVFAAIYRTDRIPDWPGPAAWRVQLTLPYRSCHSPRTKRLLSHVRQLGDSVKGEAVRSSVG